MCIILGKIFTKLEQITAECSIFTFNSQCLHYNTSINKILYSFVSIFVKSCQKHFRIQTPSLNLYATTFIKAFPVLLLPFSSVRLSLSQTANIYIGDVLMFLIAMTA